MKASQWLGLVLAGICWSTDVVRAEDRSFTWTQALQEALYRNPEIRAAQAELEVAQGVRLVFRSRTLPQVNFTVPAGYRGRRPNEGETTFFSASLLATEPLFDYSIPAALRRSRIVPEIALQNLAQTTVEQLHQTRMAFIEALAARVTLEALQIHAGRLHRNTDSQQQRFSAGFCSIREVKLAQRAEEEIQTRTAQARAVYQSAVATLAQLMGRDPGASAYTDPHLFLSGHLEFPEFTINLSEEVKVAMAHRPDLMALRQTVLQFETDARLAASGYYPLLRVYAGGRYVPTDSYRTDKQSLRNTSLKSEYRAGVDFSWRVVDLGTVQGAVLSQTKLADSYRALLRRIENNIPLEIAAARNAYLNARSRYYQNREIIDYAEKVLSLIENQIQTSGQTLNQSSQLDFNFAQNSLLEVQLGQIRSQADALIAAAELDRATGRYVQPKD